MDRKQKIINIEEAINHWKKVVDIKKQGTHIYEELIENFTLLKEELEKEEKFNINPSIFDITYDEVKRRGCEILYKKILVIIARYYSFYFPHTSGSRQDYIDLYQKSIGLKDEDITLQFYIDFYHKFHNKDYEEIIDEIKHIKK